MVQVADASSAHATPRASRNEMQAFANRSPSSALGRVLHLTMKHGKYNLHKTSANSFGTSYSWYYRKNDNPTTRKKKKLKRSASDSTLFSDYANQIPLFEKEKAFRKKCKKSASDVGKMGRVKYNPRNIKPVYMEPFTGNFYYGKALPGYEFSQKTEEKIDYLPDSDAVTASESLITTESLTTPAPTVVDAPELVKNPLYGCVEADVQITTPEYLTDSTTSKDSQLKSSSCTELRRTMCTSKASEDILSNILKDYKRIMKEWNTTITDHYSSASHDKKASTMCRRSNTDSFVRSLRSTLSCRKPSRCHKPASNKYYHYAYSQNLNNKREIGQNKTQSLNRNQTLGNWSSTLQKFRKKTRFWKGDGSLTPSECKCLEAIYEDYDRRLQDWCDTISHCSTLLASVHNSSKCCTMYDMYRQFVQPLNLFWSFQGYKMEIEKPENQHLLPATLVGQADVLFGNLHELFTFHQDVFLKDLEKSISATELVALCFVEKVSTVTV